MSKRWRYHHRTRAHRRAGATVACTALGVALVVTALAHAAPEPLPPVASTATSIRIERPADVPRATFALRRVVGPDTAGAERVTGPDGAPLELAKEVIVDEKDVTAVFVDLDVDLDHYDVTLHFADAAAQRLHEATRDLHSHPRIALLVDGKVVAAPVVMEPLGPAAMLSSRYTMSEATALAQRLAP
jgi:preprotein translocase subunit SecD